MIRFLFVALVLAAPVAAQTWTSAPPLSTPRSAAAAAVLDGRLYVVGGRSAGGQVLRSGEVFTPGVGWAPIASLDDPRAGARLLAVGGRLYLVGGHDDEGPEDDMEVYTPGTDSWDSEDSMEEERDGVAAGVVGGRIYALGGADEDGLLGNAEVFDVGADDWSPVAEWSLTPARASAGSASDGGGVVVAGGFSTLGPLATVQRFVPGSAGASLPDFPSPRGGVSLTSAGQTLFAAGGRDASDERLASALRLDPSASSWTVLPALPEGREDAAAVVLGSDLYVVGGTGAFGSVLASVVRLDGVIVDDENGPNTDGLTVELDGPNPSRGAVRLRVSTDWPTIARIVVLDLRGREIATLHDGPLPATERRLTWNAGSTPAGLYLLRITTPTAAKTVRIAILGR